jgi:hypothetical protein
VRVDEDTGDVELSQIFNWYKQDFVQGSSAGDVHRGMMQWVSRYLDQPERDALERSLKAGRARWGPLWSLLYVCFCY